MARKPSAKTEELEVVGGELLPQSSQGLALPIDVDRAIEYHRAYREACEKLLDPDDYLIRGKQSYKKKAAWRKLSSAFNLSEWVPVDEHGNPDPTRSVQVPARREDGWPLYAHAYVVMESPQGRRKTGYQEAHLGEKCCPVASGGACSKGGTHQHCKKGCDGTPHWSHPGDIPALAHTRACNRATADLIGCGEVSAEEMEQAREGKPAKPKGAPASDKQRQRLETAIPILAKAKGWSEAEVLAYYSHHNGLRCDDLERLCQNGRWAGATWGAMKDDVKEVCGDAYEQLFPD